jgi:hypothetical protein
VTFQDLGSVGEFLAAIATLATLIYLARQIRQNSEAVKTAAAQSVLAGVNAALQNAASTPQLARVVILGQTDSDQLSEEERQQYILWLFSWFRTVEQAHHNYLLGHLDARIWEGLARHLQSVVHSPVIQTWWRLRESVFSPEFREFFNGLNHDSTIPSVDKLFDEIRPDGPAA